MGEKILFGTTHDDGDAQSKLSLLAITFTYRREQKKKKKAGWLPACLIILFYLTIIYIFERLRSLLLLFLYFFFDILFKFTQPEQEYGKTCNRKNILNTKIYY